VLAQLPGARTAAWVVLAAGAAALVWGPQLLGLTWRQAARLRPSLGAPPLVSHGLLLRLAAANALAWLAYGLGFWCLARALSGAGAGSLAAASAVFIASYLAGFLALFAPGGIGVREAVLYGSLTGLHLTTPAGAAVLVAGSRVWLTVLEVLPGLLFLPSTVLARRNSISSAPHGPTG
jgi:glycosyltransferase 2 family protein